jgi:hypothetical protein
MSPCLEGKKEKDKEKEKEGGDNWLFSITYLCEANKALLSITLVCSIALLYC